MTIYDIAKIANVSASTVSRVINGKPGVKEETRKKVAELLKQNHFSINEAARGLVMQTSRLVGILLADIRNLHHMQGAYYIQSELEKRGYCGIILNTGTSVENMKHAISVLEQRRVEGAVLMGSVFQEENIKKILTSSLTQVPVIMINGQLDLPNCYCVMSDEKNGIAKCVRYLVSKGRRQIVYLTDPLTPSNQLKVDGFWEGIKQAGPDVKGWLYRDDDGDRLKSSKRMMELALKEHPQADGVICAVDLLAAGALQFLHERNIEVPEKIALIGVDNSLYGQICYPQLTTLDNQIFSACVMGAHQLFDYLEGGNPPHCVSIQADLIFRGTA